MVDDPAQIARKAKGLQQALKELLKTHEPWEKDVDIQRKNLREQYLRLLLVYPYSPESKDAETHLWMQTSYGFIANYKHRIGTLDRTIHGSPRQQQQQQQQQQQSRQHGGHVVEYRKLLQRFRQFLAEEQKFWVELIVRIRRCLPPNDPSRSTVRLDMIPDDDTAPANGDVLPKRNHHRFPPDADVVPVSSTLTSAQRESWLGILSKALVCLGDIERYKEQYNEAGGRPRAGYEDGPPAVVRNGRNRRAAPVASAPVPRMRNYEKAQKCYEQARLLQPHDGNPSHQLAIIAAYQKDNFGALVQYYRALCVATPYDTAADNLTTMLSKALEQWNTRGSRRDREREKEEARSGVPMAPRLRVEALKERLIVLHALWQDPTDEADAASTLGRKVVDTFKSLVSERVLPIDLIIRVVLVCQGALWKHRTFRPPSPNFNGRSRNTASRLAVMESHIATHIVALYRVLLVVGIAELREATEEDDLAQRITATFRRTLPALRLSSKWLLANLSYVLHSRPSPSRVDNEDSVIGNNRPSRGVPTLFIDGLPQFWNTYVHFMNALSGNFPVEKLPTLDAPLDEDVEGVAFLPLKRIVSDHISSTHEGRAMEMSGVVQRPTLPVSSPRTQTHPNAHPNEEQLMRIADLLADAQALVDLKETPISRSMGVIVFEGASESLEIHPTSPEQQYTRIPAERLPQIQDMVVYRDDMTETSRTDDDPVDEAIRVGLGGFDDSESDEEEDEIVWRIRSSRHRQQDLPSLSPNHDPPRQGFDNPRSPIFTPRAPGPTSPLHQSNYETGPIGNITSAPISTTAQDLLQNVLGIQRSPLSSENTWHHRGLSAPQVQRIFGSTQLNGPSIWSTVHGGTSPELSHSTTSGGIPPQRSIQQSALPDPYPPRQSGMSSYSSQTPGDYAGNVRTTFSSTQPSFHAISSGHQRGNSHSDTLTRSQRPIGQNRPHSYDPFEPFPSSRAQPPAQLHNLGMPNPYADPSVSMSNHGRFASDPQYRGQQDFSMSYSTSEAAQDPSNIYRALHTLSQPWDSHG